MSADKGFEEWYASIGVRTIADIEAYSQEVWLASRKAALEEAAKLCLDRSEWIKGRQDGPPEELSNTIIRHHASASFADSDAILALVSNPPAKVVNQQPKG